MNDELPVNPTQAFVDAMGERLRKKRSTTQLTLGELIALLKDIEHRPGRQVTGLGKLGSYRGYYSDLAFGGHVANVSPEKLLEHCQAAMGRPFQGYKGGEFFMHENTPLWLSEYGRTSGIRLMGLDLSGDPIKPITDYEDA